MSISSIQGSQAYEQIGKSAKTPAKTETSAAQKATAASLGSSANVAITAGAQGAASVLSLDDSPPVIKYKEKKEEAANYEINTKAPTITFGDKNVEKAINAQITNIVNAKVKSYKTESTEGKNFYDLTMEAKPNKSLLVVSQMEYMSFEGAAHGNSTTETMMFDLKKGNLVELKDLFKPNSNYLQELSKFCTKDLIEQGKKQDINPDTSWIEAGTAPEPMNYRSFEITDDGIAITFDPYQAGAYAEGAKTSVVPFAYLQDLVNPNSPIKDFMPIQSVANEIHDTGSVNSFDKKFAGTINNKYKVEMDLKSDGSEVTGSYKYTSQKQGLQIKGTIDADMKFTIGEFDAKGVQTGVFKGSFIGGDVVGTWSRPNGDKPMPFNLSEIK